MLRCFQDEEFKLLVIQSFCAKIEVGKIYESWTGGTHGTNIVWKQSTLFRKKKKKKIQKM